jgi:hypothetical protein
MGGKSITSRSSVVCRYLLYSIAREIGQYTLLLVLYLTPYHISKIECGRLDDLITADLFPHEDIERAAYRTLNQYPITFSTFLVELFFP